MHLVFLVVIKKGHHRIGPIPGNVPQTSPETPRNVLTNGTEPDDVRFGDDNINPHKQTNTTRILFFLLVVGPFPLHILLYL
jgi:hypothetical protein